MKNTVSILSEGLFCFEQTNRERYCNIERTRTGTNITLFQALVSEGRKDRQPDNDQ